MVRIGTKEKFSCVIKDDKSERVLVELLFHKIDKEFSVSVFTL